MADKQVRRGDKTPAGRLEEARLQSVLGYQLAQAAIVADTLFDQHAGQPLGLRPIEYTVLTLIDENPGGSLVRLARALAVTAPVITVIVDRLAQQGWVQRATNANDRRSQVLTTTKQGGELARQATDKIMNAERAALPLSPGERAMLLELLHKVAMARPALKP